MLRFAIRRVLIMIPLLVGVSFISFALMNLIPCSPVTMPRSLSWALRNIFSVNLLTTTSWVQAPVPGLSDSQCSSECPSP